MLPKMTPHELTVPQLDARGRAARQAAAMTPTPERRKTELARAWRSRGRAWIYPAILCANIALIAGCTSSSEREYVATNPGLSRTLRVALIPFENLTSHPQAGLIMAELLATELYNRRVFNLVESTELRRELNQRKVDTSQLARTTIAAELAAMLDVDAVIVGSVSEFSYQHGLHEEPTVGINARLVTAGAGEVLWAASYSDTGRGLLRRDSLNEAAQRVAARMVAALDNRLGPGG